MTTERYQQGERNISDGRFVRTHYIPLAIEQKRWNIAVYEAQRATELLIKGMIRLTDVEPPHNHQIDRLVDFLCSEIEKLQVSLPFLYVAYADNGNCYGVLLRDKCLEVLKRVAGTFTSIGTYAFGNEISIDDVMDISLEVTESCIKFYMNNNEVLSSTDSSIRGPFRFRREFCLPSSEERLHELKKTGSELHKSRNAAFYGEKDFSEQDARNSIKLMDTAHEAVKTLFFEDKSS